MSHLVPGAAQTQRLIRACAAVGEAAGKKLSAEGRDVLNVTFADQRFVLPQLLAAFGLALDAENTGDASRAEQLRTFIRQTAPHCGPLAMSTSDFSDNAEAHPPLVSPVSNALARTQQLGSAYPTQRAKTIRPRAHLPIPARLTAGNFLGASTVEPVH
ncbi:MAG: hypothetical protein IPK82_35250 [Polyangiaceae bacterium]|nr:hypothetical protein [Polyangiaceae bacterium]